MDADFICSLAFYDFTDFSTPVGLNRYNFSLDHESLFSVVLLMGYSAKRREGSYQISSYFLPLDFLDFWHIANLK